MNLKGAMAERAASNYLIRKNYTLLDYNYTSQFGEIDLIFRDGNDLVFVEVKARDVRDHALPREYVDVRKQRKMILTAERYIKQKKLHLQPRFDIVEVFCEKGKIKSVNHLEKAFDLDYNIK